MTDRTSKVVSLPTWDECAKAVDGGYATHLQTFIYHNEPSDTGVEGFQTEGEFRKQLALMIEYERQQMPTSGETADESGWMVERTTPSAPSWLSSVIPIRWNTNANAGIRFCRRQDACEVMEGIRPLEPSEPTMRVTEHIWCDMVHLAQSSPKTPCFDPRTSIAKEPQ